MAKIEEDMDRGRGKYWSQWFIISAKKLIAILMSPLIAFLDLRFND
jgi:hypothetical protein